MVFCAYCLGHHSRTTYYRVHRLGFCIRKPASARLETDSDDGASSDEGGEGECLDRACEHCGQVGLCKWAYKRFHKATGCVKNATGRQGLAGEGSEGELLILLSTGPC